MKKYEHFKFMELSKKFPKFFLDIFSNFFYFPTNFIIFLRFLIFFGF